MACAYVVLAHKAPDQVGRLIDRLAPSKVVLHVDASADADILRKFRTVASDRPNVQRLPGRSIGWAGWSQVDAYLDGIRMALQDGADHVAMLSGQDYPLRPATAIEQFLAGMRRTSFLAAFPLPNPLWGADGGLHRVRRWTVTVSGRRVGLPIPRRQPDGLDTPYGGPAFCVLSRAAATYLGDFVERRPDTVRFYKRTWLPVEMYIHTVLMNSPFRDEVVGESFWHVEWPETPSKHPHVLTVDALPRLKASARGPSTYNGRARFKLFARKFDATVDGAVLDRVDAELLGVPPGGGPSSPAQA